MIITAYDQLICVDEADSYAASMGMDFPTDAANAQYYKKNGNKVDTVSPKFDKNTQSEKKELLFFPQVFAAIGTAYLTPGTNDVFTFRLNSLSGSNAIIARGTVADFKGGGALVDGSRVWNTTDQGPVAQTYADVFQATTYTFQGIEVPALGICGQLAYGTQSDVSIYCTIDFEGGSISCKGDFEIRSMETDVFKLVISAQNPSGENDRVIDTSSEQITLTARLLRNGTTTDASGFTFNWYNLKDETTVLGTGVNFQVTQELVPGHAIFVCKASNGTSLYTASIDIDDIQDRYAIQKGRTVYSQYHATNPSERVVAENSNVIKKTYTVTYAPSVIDTTTGATSTETWVYSAILKDNTGGQTQTYSGITPSNPLVISGSLVKNWGGMNVHLQATNNRINS